MMNSLPDSPQLLTKYTPGLTWTISLLKVPVFTNVVFNELLSYMTLIPLISSEFSQEATRNVFYKMYEYYYGQERATRELEIIGNQIDELSNISKVKFVLYYLLAVLVGIPVIFMFLVMREVIPRFIIGCKYNSNGILQ
ncbi:unnamed protein product [Hanseniaspora opuntiae]